MIDNVPVLDDDTSFECWEKDVRIWLLATKTEKQRRAASLVLAMKGRAKAICRNLDPETLQADDGVESVVNELKKVFEQDNTQTTFSSIEKFETLLREPNQSINDYISIFSERYRDLKTRLGGEDLYSTQILAYRLLSQANLGNEQRRLVRATCQEITFEGMASQLKKAFGEGVPNVNSASIKSEPESDKEEIFYNSNNYPVQCRICNKRGHTSSQCWSRNNTPGRQANNPNRDRDRRRWSNPEMSTNPNNYSQRTPNILQMDELRLVDEVGAMGVLDTGAAGTVCGERWLSLFEEVIAQRLTRTNYEKSFRFGAGDVVKSSFSVKIPAFVCDEVLEVDVFVLPIDIPLLLSRSTLQSWRAIVNLERNVLQIGSKYQSIKLTKSGHQTIDIVKDRPESILTMTEDNTIKLSPTTIAKKLHRYFAHGSRKKIVEMVKDSTHPQKDDIISALNSLSCEQCIKLSNRKPIRKVGLPRATRFNECVAMDLKMINDKWTLHMIDSFSRFSVIVPVKNKTGKEILEKIFRFWISIFGTPVSFMTDNGGEFVNEGFLELASKLEITLHSSPAESPWCNGVVERHNGILANMIMSTMKESRVSLEIACSWAASAKNSLTNQSGFSPHQLVFGKNPQMPTWLDRNSYQESMCEEEIIEENMIARQAARDSFIKLENDGRISRVLKHRGHVQDTSNYVAGDSVYYKREDNRSWFGIAQVVGHVDNQIIIKHGGALIRIHPSKVKRVEKDENEEIGKNSGTMEGNKDEEQEVVDEDDHGNDDEGRSVNEVKCREFNDDDGECDVENQEEEAGQAQVEDDAESKDTEERSKVWRNYPLRSRAHMEPEPEVLVSMEEESVIFFNAGGEDEIKEAKNVEMARLQEFDAYSEIDEGDAGSIISTRWVIVRKENGKVKARLVVRGFEEWRNGASGENNSPTVQKFAVRLLLSLAAHNGWRLKCMDITSAFLQSDKIQRNVFVRPPTDVRTEGKVWKLNKPLYGLGDASRNWYKTFSGALQEVCSMTTIDKTTFYQQNQDGKIIGMVTIHVDDVLIAGNDEFYRNIQPAISKFKIGKIEDSSFSYLGWEVQKEDNGTIRISQEKYRQSSKEDMLAKLMGIKRPVEENVSQKEADVMKACIGKLMWLSNQTMPHLSFPLLDLSTKRSWTGRDVKTLRKIVNSVQPLSIVFRNIDVTEATIEVFCDASLGNLSDFKSGHGFLVFLRQQDTYNLLAYSCGKVKRVVKSVFAAELYAVSEAVNYSIMIRKFITEVTGEKLKIVVRTDSKQVVESVRTISSMPREKATILELREVQHHHEEGEIEVEWIPSKLNPADVMTKNGVCPDVMFRYVM